MKKINKVNAKNYVRRMCLCNHKKEEHNNEYNCSKCKCKRFQNKDKCICGHSHKTNKEGKCDVCKCRRFFSYYDLE